MSDHPKDADPKGLNPSGQGPAQPLKPSQPQSARTPSDHAGNTKQPGAASASPETQADADEDTND